jgi:hypothetical protein
MRSTRLVSSARSTPKRASARDIALDGSHADRSSSSLVVALWQTTRVGSAVPLGLVGGCCEEFAFVRPSRRVAHTARLRPKRLTLSAPAASNAEG